MWFINVINFIAQYLTQSILVKRNICVRLEKHATYNDSLVFNYIYDGANHQYIKNLYCIGNKSFHAYTYDINSIPEDTNIIGSTTNWNTLLIKETLHIKLQKPVLSSGLKASKSFDCLINFYSKHILMGRSHGFSHCF